MRISLTRLVRNTAGIGLVLLLAGCATSLRPPYSFNEVQVLNKTGSILTEVKIRNVKRNRVFECGNIAPNGICSDSFRPRPYRGEPIEVTWTVGGQTPQTETFIAKVPDYLDPGRPVRGVLVIGRRGGTQAFFEQDPRTSER